jgi:hypothetical protein
MDALDCRRTPRARLRDVGVGGIEGLRKLKNSSKEVWVSVVVNWPVDDAIKAPEYRVLR